MTVGPPRLRVENEELASNEHLARELADGQVEAHPRREPESGREPKDDRVIVDLLLDLEQMVLDGHFRHGVRGEGPQLELFVGRRTVGNEAIV